MFDDDAINPKLWGVYATIPSKKIVGNQEIYYLGFQSNNSTFNEENCGIFRIIKEWLLFLYSLISKV